MSSTNHRGKNVVSASSGNTTRSAPWLAASCINTMSRSTTAARSSASWTGPSWAPATVTMRVMTALWRQSGGHLDESGPVLVDHPRQTRTGSDHRPPRESSTEEFAVDVAGGGHDQPTSAPCHLAGPVAVRDAYGFEPRRDGDGEFRPTLRDQGGETSVGVVDTVGVVDHHEHGSMWVGIERMGAIDGDDGAARMDCAPRRLELAQRGGAPGSCPATDEHVVADGHLEPCRLEVASPEPEGQPQRLALHGSACDDAGIEASRLDHNGQDTDPARPSVDLVDLARLAGLAGLAGLADRIDTPIVAGER